jgi:hypothetical protein
VYPGVASFVDFRAWSRGTWLVFNLTLVLILLGVRFIPNVAHDYQQRGKRCEHDAAKQVLQEKANERRQKIEQIQRSRNRRIY